MVPARPGARAGAFVSLVLLLSAAGCDRLGVRSEEGPRVLELAHDTIRLEPGVRLHEIEIRRESAGEFHPAQLRAAPGDVVRFRAGDRGGHAISFVGSRLDPASREFLDESGQLRSPPLITTGASWVITLEGAPPGVYPFHCTTHNVVGRLEVAPR
jgi:plastocyanin